MTRIHGSDRESLEQYTVFPRILNPSHEYSFVVPYAPSKKRIGCETAGYIIKFQELAQNQVVGAWALSNKYKYVHCALKNNVVDQVSFMVFYSPIFWRLGGQT